MSSKFASGIATTTLVCLSAALGAGSALAQSASPAQALLDNSWVLNLGAFVLATDTRASLNGQSLTNPEIDFDQTLGTADDATRVRGDALWRITPGRRQLSWPLGDNYPGRWRRGCFVVVVGP